MADQGLFRASAAMSLSENIAEASAAGKSGVLIPADTVLPATGPISLPSGFALVGESPETSGIVFSAMPNDSFVLKNARDNVFAHLVIDCSAIGENKSSSVIRLQDCADVLVERVTFLTAPGHALAGDCEGLTVRNCRFLDGRFVRISVSGDRHAVLYNLFEGGDSHVLQPGSKGDVYPGRDWYPLQPGGKGHLYLGNVFVNTGVGIQTGGMANSLLAHNYFPQLLNHGVWLRSPSARDNILAFNDFRYTGYNPERQQVFGSACAIQSWSGAANLMVGNFGSNIAGYGINISGDSRTMINELYSAFDGADNVVSDNVFVRSTDPNILVNNAFNAVVRRNRVGDSISLGLHIGCEVNAATSGALLAKVINNYIWGNSFSGAWLDACYGMVFQGNWIINCGGTSLPWAQWGVGIRTRYGATPGGLHMYNKIIGNTVADLRPYSSGRAQRYALYIEDPPPEAEGTISRDIIRWNRFYGSLEENIQMSDAMKAGHTIEHNDLTGSDHEALKGAPPLADAGPSLVVGDGSRVVLTGLRSRCFDGTAPQPWAYHWNQISGPPMTASGADTPNLQITIPELAETTIYGFELTVIRTDSGRGTKDWVYVGAYDDEWIPPSLAMRGLSGQFAQAKAPSGWQLLLTPETEGWQFSSEDKAMEANLRGGGFGRLIAENKVFGQQVAVQLRAGRQTLESFAEGDSAGLVLLNTPWLEAQADGFFVGLHRARGEARARLKVIMLRQFDKSAFMQATETADGVLYSAPAGPEGGVMEIGITRLGDTYKLSVDGRQVAVITLDYRRPGPDPPVDGCFPTVVGYQLCTSEGAPPLRILFENLRVDN